MVASLFQAWSSCLSKHDHLNLFGTPYLHVSGPHHPTMGGTLGVLIDRRTQEGIVLVLRRGRGYDWHDSVSVALGLDQLE